MDCQGYLKKMKEIHNLLLSYINNDDNSDDGHQTLINCIEIHNILQDKKDFKKLLQLILKISKNCHRISGFFERIEEIILNLKDEINQIFSNIEIFYLFRNNKRILLFLLQKNIITLDQSIFELIVQTSKSKGKEYLYYFYPEISIYLSEKNKGIIENELFEIDSNIYLNFEENRQLGENSSYICQLIRDDSIDEFVIYVNKTNFPLSSKIKFSLFETNSFLIKKEPNLLEYAAFYGSIQIFHYLRFSHIEFSPSLWLYSIHGANAEIIHILEENHIDPPDEDDSYEACLKEAIKCHHNNIANYIQNNLLNQGVELNNLQNKFNKNSIFYCFRYCNYDLLPDEFNNKFVFYYACRYDFLNLVEFLYEKNKIDINDKLILKKLFLMK